MMNPLLGLTSRHDGQADEIRASCLDYAIARFSGG
jgi:hypothetical protein